MSLGGMIKPLNFKPGFQWLTSTCRCL